MARIFISYRREDSGAAAGRLHDRLRDHYGRDNVFMDVDSIEPGLDFVEAIERTVGSCDILIALIGRHWLTVTDAEGRRRLDDPGDFVRHEVVTALKRNVRVIPALIQGTRMPRAEELPEALTPLTRRHALDLSDAHFHRDVDGLIEVLDRALGITPSPSLHAGPVGTVTAEPPEAGPADHASSAKPPPGERPPADRWWKTPTVIAAMIAALAAILVAIIGLGTPKPKSSDPMKIEQQTHGPNSPAIGGVGGSVIINQPPRDQQP